MKRRIFFLLFFVLSASFLFSIHPEQYVKHEYRDGLVVVEVFIGGIPYTDVYQKHFITVLTEGEFQTLKGLYPYDVQQGNTEKVVNYLEPLRINIVEIITEYITPPYKVIRNDSLHEIILKYYSYSILDSKGYVFNEFLQYVAGINSLKTPHLIEEGMDIYIPKVNPENEDTKKQKIEKVKQKLLDEKKKEVNLRAVYNSVQLPSFDINNSPISIYILRDDFKNVGIIIGGHAEEAICKVVSAEVMKTFNEIGENKASYFSYGIGYDFRPLHSYGINAPWTIKYHNIIENLREELSPIAEENPHYLRITNINYNDYVAEHKRIYTHIVKSVDKRKEGNSEAYVIQYKDIPFPLILPYYDLTTGDSVSFSLKKDTVHNALGELVGSTYIDDILSDLEDITAANNNIVKIMNNIADYNLNTMKNLCRHIPNQLPETDFNNIITILSEEEAQLIKGIYQKSGSSYFIFIDEKNPYYKQALDIFKNNNLFTYRYYQYDDNKINGYEFMASYPPIQYETKIVREIPGIQSSLQTIGKTHIIDFSLKEAEKAFRLKEGKVRNITFNFNSDQLVILKERIVKRKKYNEKISRFSNQLYRMDDTGKFKSLLDEYKKIKNGRIYNEVVDAYLRGWPFSDDFALLEDSFGKRRNIWKNLLLQKSIEQTDGGKIAHIFNQDNVFFKIDSDEANYIITPYYVVGGSFIQVIGKEEKYCQFFTPFNFRELAVNK